MTERGRSASMAERMTEGISAVAGVALLIAAAALAALLELSLVPLYLNGHLVRVSVPLAIAGNWILPRLARSLADSAAVMAAVVAAWLLPLVALSMTSRPEGDVYVLGNSDMQWVYFATLILGTLTGMLTVVLAGPRPAPRPPAAPPQPPGSVR